MAPASLRNAARRAFPAHPRRALALAALALSLPTLVSLPGCQPATPLEPVVRAAPRHPIRRPDWATTSPARPTPTTVSGSDRSGRITPGPNSRVSPTPDMAPRREPADRPDLPSTQRDVDDLQRDLRQQRKREREEPGPPAGTIDRRPGTIRTTPGTIEIPR